jgi:hypothetical protein
MKTLFCFAFVVFNLCLFAQTNTKCNACTFLNTEIKGEKALFDKPGGEIINYQKHNLEGKNYYNLIILDKNDSMFYALVEYAIDGEFITKGWIKKDRNIGIYSRAYNEPLKLYCEPNESSKVNCIIKEYNPEMYIVTDCVGEWLKVKTIFHGKEYTGWMSPTMQCCNVYSTCS